MVAAPSATLHLTNLNDKLKKEELRAQLYSLCSLYGKVLDVVATRAPKMRGVAFVVYRDVQGSSAALRALDGEAFFGKQLRITYATSISHATIAATQGPEAVYALKAGLKNSADKLAANVRLTVSGAQKKAFEDAQVKKRGREELVEEDDEDDEDEEEEPALKKGKGKEKVVVEPDAMEEDSGDETTLVAVPLELPSTILWIQSLPNEITNDMLSPLFQQYPGLSSLKLQPIPADAGPNSGHAYVQYESISQATTAKDALDQFEMDKGVFMKVSWAKRS